MPKGEVKTNQRETLALIKAAGAEGIPRKKLVESIDASEQSVDNHIWALNRDGAIFKPKLGLLVAIELKQPPAASPELARLAAPPSVAVAKEPATVVVATPSSHPKDARVTNPKSPWRSAPATDSPRARPFKSAEVPVCTNSQSDFAIPSSPAEKQEVAEQLAALNLPGDLGDLLMPEEAFETIEVKGIPDRRGPAVILVEHEEDFEIGIFSDSTMTLVWEDGINAATIEFRPEAVKKLRRFLGLFAEAV